MNRRARKILAAAGWLAAAPFIALASRWLSDGIDVPREADSMAQYERRP
jgi:hypothetical protein